MARIEHHYGAYLINGRLVQSDYDYPAEATALGWSITRVQKRPGEIVHLARRSKVGCQHRGTDGTVNCPDCGVTASSFIRYAAEYLDSRV